MGCAAGELMGNPLRKCSLYRATNLLKVSYQTSCVMRRQFWLGLFVIPAHGGPMGHHNLTCLLEIDLTTLGRSQHFTFGADETREVDLFRLLWDI